MQQAEKVYVQDRIQQRGELIWKLLEQGAHFYVCGDAAHMAGSVEKALLGIIEQVTSTAHWSFISSHSHLCCESYISFDAVALVLATEEMADKHFAGNSPHITVYQS